MERRRLRRLSVQTAHTAELNAPILEAARAIFEGAFEGYAPEDWEHALGGVHALAWEGDDLVGHAAIVHRRLLHGGRALRTGYVEGVAVRADRRGHGHGAALMDAIERIVRRAYELGALSVTDEAERFYPTRSWQRWRGPTSALTPAGVTRTPDDDGGVYVLPVSAPLDLDGELACDWRDGDLW